MSMARAGRSGSCLNYMFFTKAKAMQSLLRHEFVVRVLVARRHGPSCPLLARRPVATVRGTEKYCVVRRFSSIFIPSCAMCDADIPFYILPFHSPVPTAAHTHAHSRTRRTRILAYCVYVV